MLSFPDGGLWAVEIERSLTPRLQKGFRSACADLVPERRFVVYPGTVAYAVGREVQAVPLGDLARLLGGVGP